MAEAVTLWDAARKAEKLMFIGAHPDDEIIVGPFLAWFAEMRGTVDTVSLTGGEAGWNLHVQDLDHTLQQVREEEYKAAMKILGCIPRELGYVNGLSMAHPEGVAVKESADTAMKRWQAIDKKESPDKVMERWGKQKGDPVEAVGGILWEEQPDIILTFDPETGFTNHEEHMAVSMVVSRAAAAYAGTARKPLLLYQFHPENGNEGMERIEAKQLAAEGKRDYEDVSVEAHACYESQYGTRGSEESERYIFRSRQRNEKFFFTQVTG